MLKYLKRFEKMITGSLAVMMALVVLFATIDLGWLIVKDILSPPVLILDVEEPLDIFGPFLLILIGMELLETIKVSVVGLHDILLHHPLSVEE